MNRLRRASPYVLIGSAVLLLTIAFSQIAGMPVRSIFPYGFAVMLVTWRHNIGSGFLFAGLGTLTALVAGAFPTKPEWSGEELGEGFVTYLKLTVVAIAVDLCKR